MATNPKNPPRPPHRGCPRDVDPAHSCFHCADTWRCTTCAWPLVLDPNTHDALICPHCEGTVLTEREWYVAARTGRAPADLYTRGAAPKPPAADEALTVAMDVATVNVTMALLRARAAHARAASDLDAAKEAHKQALLAMRTAERAMLAHFDIDTDGDR